MSTAASLVDNDRTNSGIRLDPALQSHESVVPDEPKRGLEIGGFADDPDDEAIAAKEMDRKLHAIARQAALDHDDGVGM